MNMASNGILLIFTVICINMGCNAKEAFIKVECKAENLGQYGQQSLLECVVQTSQAAANAEIRVVTWSKDDGTLLVFHDGDTTSRPGYSFAEPSWNDKNMNVSLLIANTAVEHEGVYKCTVVTDSGDGSNVTNLKVTAKYNKPTIRSDPEKLHPNTAGTLICNSNGGYPQGEIRWIVGDDTDWTKSAEMEAKPTDSGLISLSSKLTLLEKSTFHKYTCVVFNASGGKEEEVEFEFGILNSSIQDQDRQSEKSVGMPTKIAAPAVVIGSLIVGLLLALLIHKKRSQRGNHMVPTSIVEEGDHLSLEDGNLRIV
ncbi:uncharacterized protein zgc:174863 isoform X2 [Centropristis striata]|uniref:uncharacterized protein zgc:174863 isoform X2 n=1 Tax=Centropristis striata TaxID=184440 RepID=UPI0027DF0BB5|nr:uncharacterized protein zgc:174863 isoform X2 [Centropristis striata]